VKKSEISAPIIPGEGRLLGGLFFILFGLRILYACFMTFNSDEAQHLHVVWGWANGLLQYRDVFDNHTPLFHLLCAPIFRRLGETPKIIIYMRLVMIPVSALGLWFVARIGERLFSRRVGWWAALLTGFAPFFFLKTVEFRTDDLWTTLWLATVMVSVSGPFNVRRLFFTGLILGATFSVSMKSVLMLLGLLLAAAIALWNWKRSGGPLQTREIILGLLAGLAGLLIIPAILVGYFASQGALEQMKYCVIQHNVVPEPGHAWHFRAEKDLWFPFGLPLLIFASREIFKRSRDRETAVCRVLVLLTGGFFATILASYWPMITGQDFPPVVPLAVIWLTPGVLILAGMLSERWPQIPRPAFPAFLALVEIGVIFKVIHPHPRVAGYIERLDRVLHCTDPKDYVMDAKSGAIYRRRPIYYALENVTLKRLRLKLIKDEIIPALINTRTCMVSDERLSYSDFDGRDYAFVRKNYLPFCDSYRVAGQLLNVDPASGKCAFEISIPTEYVILVPEGDMQGTLDGKPYSGKVLLDIGLHELITEHPQRPHVACWAQAFERGFIPNFTPESEEKAPRKNKR